MRRLLLQGGDERKGWVGGWLPTPAPWSCLHRLCGAGELPRGGRGLPPAPAARAGEGEAPDAASLAVPSEWEMALRALTLPLPPLSSVS